VSLAPFGRLLDKFQRFTSAVALDREIEGATWHIAALHLGSCVAEAMIDIPSDAEAFANDLVAGVDALRTQALIPAGMPLRALPHVAGMGEAAREHPVTLQLLHGGRTTEIDRTVATNARVAQRAKTTSLGGFYGTIELLDLRRGRKFGLRDGFTRQWIPCRPADDEVLEEARQHIGGQRVFVAGEITENPARQPLSILVQTVEPQPWAASSIAGFRGTHSDPQGRSAAEVVREQRDW
jgi:hypothetical protein